MLLTLCLNLISLYLKFSQLIMVLQLNEVGRFGRSCVGYASKYCSVFTIHSASFHFQSSQVLLFIYLFYFAVQVVQGEEGVCWSKGSSIPGNI